MPPILPLHRLAALLLVAACLLTPVNAQKARRLTLENGIRVTVIPVPKARVQTTFTFLPVGFLSDGPAQTQSAHLIEHMLLAAADPDRPAATPADAIRFDAETTGSRLRLETHAPPEQWREALVHHVGWFQARDQARKWDARVLRREQESIRAELESDLEEHATHKLALAAWSQVFRYGERAVSFSGPGSLPKLADLQREYQSRVRVGPEVEIVCIGPIVPEDLIPELTRLFAPLEPDPSSMPKITLGSQGELSGEQVCTWDLAARHLLIWYPVSGEGTEHCLSAELLAQRLNFRFRQHKEDALADGRAAAWVAQVAEGQRLLFISINLDDGAKVKEASKLVAKEIKDLPRSKGMSFNDQVSALTQGMEGMLNPNAMLDRMLGFASWEQLEEYGFSVGRFALERAGFEHSCKQPIEELARVAEELDPKDVQRLAKKSFSKKVRGQLLIEPEG